MTTDATPAPLAMPGGISVGGQGRVVAQVSPDGTLRLWDLPGRQQRWQLRLPPVAGEPAPRPFAVAVSPDGLHIAVAGRLGHTGGLGLGGGLQDVLVLDAADGRVLHRLPVPHLPDRLAWSPDSARLAVSATSLTYDWTPAEAKRPERAVRVFRRAQPNGVVWQLDPDFANLVRFHAVARFAPDGRLAVAGAPGLSTTLEVFDPQGRSLVRRALRLTPSDLAWSPDGRSLAVAGQHSVLGVFNSSDLIHLANLRWSTVNPESAKRSSLAWPTAATLYIAEPVACGYMPCALRRVALAGPTTTLVPASGHPLADLSALPGGGIVFATGQPDWGMVTADGHADTFPGAAQTATYQAALGLPVGAEASRPDGVPAWRARVDTLRAATNTLGRQASLAAVARNRGANLQPALNALAEAEELALTARDRTLQASVLRERSAWLSWQGQHALAMDAQAQAQTLDDRGAVDAERLDLLRARRHLADRALDRALDVLLARWQLNGGPSDGAGFADSPHGGESRVVHAQALAAFADLAAQSRFTTRAGSIAAQQRALEALLATVGHGDHQTLRMQHTLASTLADAGQHGAALHHWQQVNAQMAEALPGDDPVRLELERREAVSRLAVGDARNAVAMLDAQSKRLMHMAGTPQLPVQAQLALRLSNETVADAALAVGQFGIARDRYLRVLKAAAVGAPWPLPRRLQVDINLGLAMAGMQDDVAARAQLTPLLRQLPTDWPQPGQRRLGDVQRAEISEALAGIERRAGDATAARIAWQLAAELWRRIRAPALLFASDADAYADVQRGVRLSFSQRYLHATLVHDLDDPDSVRHAWAEVLALKGAAESHAIRAHRWQAKGPIAMQRAAADLALARQELAGVLTSVPAQGVDPAASLRLAFERAGRAASVLSNQSAASRQAVSAQGPEADPLAGVERIAQALPDDAVLVDYVRLDGDATTPARYAAFTLRRNGQLRLHNLGLAEPIDAAVAGFQAAVRYPQVHSAAAGDAPCLQRAGVAPHLCTLHARVWAPLVAALGAARRVVLVPDGELHRVPFVALQQGDGESLLLRQRFAQVANGWALLDGPAQAALAGQAASQAPGLVVIGNPDFGRSADNGDAPALPGTAVEARQLPALVAPLSSRVFVGRAARPEALATLTPAPLILHIATHAQVRAPAHALGAAGKADGGSGLEARNYEVALANASLLLAAPAPDQKHSVLSALDIAALPLHGTALVVLSACDTAAGSVVSNQGVLGLRHAFRVAGARHVIASLWPVGDNATAALMQALYSRLGRMSVAHALHDAQLEQRQRMVANGRGNDVQAWAAFVVQGSSPFGELAAAIAPTPD